MDDMKWSRTFLFVNSRPGEVEEFSKKAPEWRWVEAPPHWPFYREDQESPPQADVVLLSAVGESEMATILTCREIRLLKPLEHAPIIVLVDHPALGLRDRMRDMPNAALLEAPVEKEQIVERLSHLT